MYSVEWFAELQIQIGIEIKSLMAIFENLMKNIYNFRELSVAFL